MKTIKCLLLFVVLLSACAPTLGIGSTMISPKDGMTLMYVPAGNFLMGSAEQDPYIPEDEKPQHTVYLDAYWIDKTDVTNKMYALCMANKGACNPPTNTSSSTRSSYYSNPQYDNYPVIYVTWGMADTYCKWAGRQLPTEAQWEKAARGTDSRLYPWGNLIDCSLANYRGKKGYCVGDTTEVGDYPKGASIYGTLDMAGNVDQWVADWYDANYYNWSPSFNPLGAASSQYRVLRGGPWNGGFEVVRSDFPRLGRASVFIQRYWFSLCDECSPTRHSVTPSPNTTIYRLNAYSKFSSLYLGRAGEGLFIIFSSALTFHLSRRDTNSQLSIRSRHSTALSNARPGFAPGPGQRRHVPC